jgi:hypothetical protein
VRTWLSFDQYVKAVARSGDGDEQTNSYETFAAEITITAEEIASMSFDELVPWP